MRNCSSAPPFVHSQHLFILYFGVAITHKQLTLSAFHIRVDVTKYVKFKIPRYKGIKVGIFRITPIAFTKLEDFSKAMSIWLSKTYHVHVVMFSSVNIL